MLLKQSSFKKVALAISGGVDSAVSALLLKKRGYNVVGVFMKNWDNLDEAGVCSYNSDLEDAEWICSKLDIPFKVVDFVKEYWNNVFVKFLDEYVEGFTPNPDILCNKYIKFNKFLKYAQNSLECDAIATGHYANTSFGNFLEHFKENKNVKLLKAKDCMKDQTFFLCNIPQSTLQRTIFPVGNLTKTQVKNIAKDNMFHPILKKRESVGICFIGRRNFKNFISQYIPPQNGKFISIDSGKSLGTHSGVHFWTIGERCRIAGNLKRSYIVHKDVQTQDVYIVGGSDHPALYITGLKTQSPHWICNTPEPLQEINNYVLECDFRYQHTYPLQKCSVIRCSDNKLVVNLKEPLCSVSRGQFIVFYSGNECLGGAQILETGPSLYTLNK